jgi:hypothetical protein
MHVTRGQSEGLTWPFQSVVATRSGLWSSTCVALHWSCASGGDARPAKRKVIRVSEGALPEDPLA